MKKTLNTVAIISVLLYFIELGTAQEGTTFFLWMERLIATVFTLEIIYQFRTEKKYLWSPEFFIDFISVAPFYIGFFVSPEHMGIIRALRVFRLLKLFWHNDSFTVLKNAFKIAWHQIRMIGFCLICIVLFASAILYNLEPENFGNIGNTIYFSLTTAFTVGYGEFTPKTPCGKLATIFLLFGPAIMVCGAFLGVIGAAFHEASKEFKISNETKV